MFRYLTLLFIVGIWVGTNAKEGCADEYGPRFQNHTPPGLAEFTVYDEMPDIAMDEAADDFQNIMPAAGDGTQGLVRESFTVQTNNTVRPEQEDHSENPSK